MTALPGNPHNLCVDDLNDQVNDWLEREGETDATMTAIALAANTQAVLALAHEQRTATLLQFLMWEPTRGLDTTGAELQEQIVQRLGLREDQ
ncbi:hypothetical protein NCCP2495_05630 [Dietzia sp. NCCP-2495]|uniref:hypothetical protein n=1 Tax=Dietzia sp. NCCP-2495 TaxID=2934675 RepID=UPI00222FFC51|nr:hypothetical protein [Dietzia sp. NCCP-2495]GLB62685.1 hypothetical protein NCCP2495_05630 [Dietzia sp. NCCP-2495]